MRNWVCYYFSTQLFGVEEKETMWYKLQNEYTIFVKISLRDVYLIWYNYGDNDDCSLIDKLPTAVFLRILATIECYAPYEDPSDELLAWII